MHASRLFFPCGKSQRKEMRTSNESERGREKEKYCKPQLNRIEFCVAAGSQCVIYFIEAILWTLNRNIETNQTKPLLNIIDPNIKHYKIYNIAQRHGPILAKYVRMYRLETTPSNQLKCTYLCAMDIWGTYRRVKTNWKYMYIENTQTTRTK